MNYVPHGPKRRVNTTLSEDLVRDARGLTTNLPETVLLADYVDAERRKREKREDLIDDRRDGEGARRRAWAWGRRSPPSDAAVLCSPKSWPLP